MGRRVDDAYDWSLRRTAAAVLASVVALIVAIRGLALAANALDVELTVAHYAFAVLPLLVLATMLWRLGSDDRFDHERYLATTDRRTLARDAGAGVVVAFTGVPAYLVVESVVPTPLALVYGLVTGALLGTTATMGLVRDYYDENPYPHYFAALDRLGR